MCVRACVHVHAWMCVSVVVCVCNRVHDRESLAVLDSVNNVRAVGIAFVLISSLTPVFTGVSRDITS